MGRQTSNSEREVIAQTAIKRAIDTIHELDNGRWKNSCNPIIKERIINGIQPLIFAAKKANDIQQGQSESSTTEFEKCLDFLGKNGFETNGKMNDYMSFYKENSIGIDLGEDEMVFIGEAGDFLHLPINKYTLIGVLLEYRQLPINYKS